MNCYFQQELDQRFSTLNTNQTYSVYNIAKEPEPCDPLTPSSPLTQVVHRLVLVTARTTSSDERMLSGMEVYEYLSSDRRQRTIYISKVDTTGSSLTRGVTRRLVQAYVATQKHLKATTNHIHVFARAQPQYLFRNSAKDKNKRILTDRQLVKWWRSALGDKELYENPTCEGKSSSISLHPYWIIPGSDDQSALYEIGQKQQHSIPTNTKSVNWRYGHPYDPQALAKDIIPKFEDDGKARYISTLLSDSQTSDDSDSDNNEEEKKEQEEERGTEEKPLTVEDFWTLFGYSEECGAGRLTGIFVVQTHDTTASAHPVDEEQDSVLDEQTYTSLWNDLMDAFFRNDQENMQSTSRFMQNWQSTLTPTKMSFTVTETMTASTTTKGTTNNIAATGDDALSPKLVHTLVVKRKSKPDSSKAVATANSEEQKLQLQSQQTEQNQLQGSSVNAVIVNMLSPKRRRI